MAIGGSSHDNDETLLFKGVKSGSAQETKLDTLTRLQVFGYTIGHFQNDLCAALWFNFILVFINDVAFKGNKQASSHAGTVLLWGQIADGLATPLVGVFSDKTNSRLGQRTPWYLFGFIIVTVSFIFIFQDCLLCDWLNDYSESMQVFYYVFFASAFNVGWAAVQVAHMSLVPSLTLSRKTRDRLNNQRNTFTYVANLFVLVFALFLFEIFKNATDARLQFKILSLGALAFGFLTSLFFLSTVNESRITKDCAQIKKQLMQQHTEADVENHTTQDHSVMPQADESSMNNVTPLLEETQVERKSVREETKSWTHWFGVPAFYLYGAVYMGVRMLVNVQSSLIIFYLQHVIRIGDGAESHNGLSKECAIIPMIVYLSSSIVSSGLKTLYEKIGRKKTFTIGAISALIGTGVMMILDQSTQKYIYPLAVLIGIGQSISLNTGISLIGEVIGADGASGAFVFGAYSLLDKFSNGIVLYYVMEREISNPINMNYLRTCTCIIPGAAILISWFLVIGGKAADYSEGDSVVAKKKKKNITKISLAPTSYNNTNTNTTQSML